MLGHAKNSSEPRGFIGWIYYSEVLLKSYPILKKVDIQWNIVVLVGFLHVNLIVYQLNTCPMTQNTSWIVGNVMAWPFLTRHRYTTYLVGGRASIQLSVKRNVTLPQT